MIGLTISSIVLILFAIAMPIIHNKRYNPSENDRVYLHILQTVLFSVISLISSIIAFFISLYSEDPFAACSVMLSISFLIALLALSTVAWNIRYNENEIVYINMFGIKSTYEYRDITEYKRDMGDITVYVGKSKMRIDAWTIGREQFLSTIKKEYRRAKGGESLKHRDRKKDIFNGNLNRPGEFIVVYVILLVLSIGIMVFSCVMLFLSDSEEELIYKELGFEAYETKGDNIVLYEKKATAEYVIYNYKMRGDLRQRIEDSFNSQNVYVVGIEGDVGEDGSYSVDAIKIKNGEEIYSYEQCLEDEHKNRLFGVALAWFVALMMIFVIVMSVIIARNPHKFSPKIIHLFFKHGYINY
ncbi:MAG: hypothetical protein E7596_05305 [Ruminococcaceae bacterium]|nr:hypothetical protein [Oscillospiraceae bacterium]